CPVIDNPGRLVDMVNKTGAHNTDPMAHESAEEFTAKCVDIAAKWMPVADRLWAEDRRIRAENKAEEEKVAAGGEK
ncbi:MAG: radical SAM protein, partial [Oscillospiraceae bacterium]|nr:radical SAM protein [Oscillospiraceae bacterium]